VETVKREHVADVFRPPAQCYTLTLHLGRYPACETSDSPTTTIWVAGWVPSFTVTDRPSIGRRELYLDLNWRVDGRLVNGSQRVPPLGHPDPRENFIHDYAIYDSPIFDIDHCPEDQFIWQHLWDACGVAAGKSTETDIAEALWMGLNGTIRVPPPPEGPECICWPRSSANFQEVWLGAVTNPVEGQSHSKGGCCCRAEGMREVIQVLGVQDYTTICGVNEKPEPNAGKVPYFGECEVCGQVWRAWYVDGVANVWQGACRSHGDHTVAYSPNGRLEGTYYEIYKNYLKPNLIWANRETGEECTHLSAPEGPEPP